MFRPLLRKSIPSNFRTRTFTKRPFGSSHSSPSQFLPPVRVLGPSLWCLTAASAVYLGCAAYEVHQDAKRLKRARPATKAQFSYDDLNASTTTSWMRGLYSDLHGDGHQSRSQSQSQPTLDPASLAGMWQNQSSTQKLTIGAIGVNASIYGACRLVPSTYHHFAHAAAGGANYTLFTSMFGHGGATHLFFNMYALYNFAEPVAASRTFRRSASHLAAFYLSAGILASLAQHLAGLWPVPMGRTIPSLGASGAIMALLGAFGASYPNHNIGIIFLPVSFPAEQALAGIALFEAYGLFIGKWMRLGHAAHLAGLVLGSGYVYLDGNTRLWEPARRFTFNEMRRLKMV